MSDRNAQVAKNQAFPFAGEVVETSPTQAWIEPTTRCNTKCRTCSHYYLNYGEDMHDDVLQIVQDKILPGLKIVYLAGYGEPLLAKRFDEMFDYCASRNMRMILTTNAILLRDRERVKKLVRSHVHLNVSIDGATKPVFESVRPFIKWEDMLGALECIRREKDAAGPDCKFLFRIHFVAMKRNIADLPEMIRIAHRYGACDVHILPLGGEDVRPELTGESLVESPEVVAPILAEAYALALKLGVNLVPPPQFRQMCKVRTPDTQGFIGNVRYLKRLAVLAAHGLRYHGPRAMIRHRVRRNGHQPKIGMAFCSLPWRAVFLSVDGSVFPCCVLHQAYGNIRDQKWEDIWNGPQYRNLRRTIHSWNPTLSCRQCALPEGTNGGNERHYQKFLAQFRHERLAIDAPGVAFDDGFSVLEYENETASHRWMHKSGSVRLPMKSGAKFLLVQLTSGMAVGFVIPGKGRVNNGPEEPFDNSCDKLLFPLDGITDSYVTLQLEMERTARIGDDDRDITLAVKEFRLLLPK